ncbi:MAG: type II toxin-antitoxin system RelE/ParE family toxin [Desulfatitalea sp.]|nr:type II toxin-antitoxin system RelE/ParE family toxin [Desulfatitalea sp.]
MINKQYHVKWALVAQRDLKQLIDYIALESPGNALQILGRIKQKASDLYTLPDRGRIVPELQDQGINIYREINVPPWRIIYRMSESTVYVLSVIDSRRNVEDILLNRFIR